MRLGKRDPRTLLAALIVGLLAGAIFLSLLIIYPIFTGRGRINVQPTNIELPTFWEDIVLSDPVPIEDLERKKEQERLRLFGPGVDTWGQEAITREPGRSDHASTGSTPSGLLP